MKVLGIDPGVRGGAAIVELTNGVITLIAAIDIPVVGVGAKERVNVLALQEWILVHGPTLAFVEHAQARPAQGASRGFKYGRAVGSLEAVVMLCALPIEVVSPGIWKRAFRLVGPDKEQSRQRAFSQVRTRSSPDAKITAAPKLHCSPSMACANNSLKRRQPEESLHEQSIAGQQPQVDQGPKTS